MAPYEQIRKNPTFVFIQHIFSGAALLESRLLLNRAGLHCLQLCELVVHSNMFNRQHIIAIAEHIRRILLLCLYSKLFSGPALPESCLPLTKAGLRCLQLGEFTLLHLQQIAHYSSAKHIRNLYFCVYPTHSSQVRQSPGFAHRSWSTLPVAIGSWPARVLLDATSVRGVYICTVHLLQIE